MERLILKSSLPPGDVLILTAAVRDLHRSYPGKFLTDVRTGSSQLWENNPYVTRVADTEATVEPIECQYPLIQRANAIPCHFLQGMTHFLSQQLGVRIEPTEFRGDIHLSAGDLAAPSPVTEQFGYEGPYWLIVSGGKRDYSIKWWDHRRFQEVVDHFRGRIQFVQVGAAGHFHPELEGVLDLRAKTNLRQLIRVMYRASGVVCPVTFLMHLCAAVPTPPPRRLRPCIVVAGGREPPHWEAYPGHQFMHTVGLLPCCREGGCWRARTKPLKDRSHFNQPEYLCRDVVNDLPRCMDSIRAADVIQRMELVLAGELRFQQEESERRRRFSEPSSREEVPSRHARCDVEKLILEHYRQAQKSLKRPLGEDLSEHVLVNVPLGLGDTVILTHLPAVAARQGKERYISSASPFFEPLMKFNRFFKPSKDRPTMAASVLQAAFELGNGHFIQRLQRAFGLEAVVIPRGHLDVQRTIKPGTVALHIDTASQHGAWQRTHVHPRARELYPESQRILEAFIENHPELRFSQIGKGLVALKNVEGRTGLPLEETIYFLSECEYFVGIVSGPMHLAAALGIKSVVILNFPPARNLILPVLKDVDLLESDWLYPQNVHLHQEDEGPLVKRFTLNNLERAFQGEIYPFWSEEYLPLIHEMV